MARRPTPARAARRQSPRGGALHGVRIVSLAQNVPGPVAVARLVGEGARALKIEPPQGDPLSDMSPAWYGELHRRVTIQRVDLKAARGRAVLDSLLAKADLLVTSQRPAALERLGLDAAVVGRAHPHLRVVRIVGDLRAADEPGHDLTYQAKAGLLGAGMPRTLLADLFGAERVVSAALLLLRHPAPAEALVGLRDALDTATALVRHGLTLPDGLLGGAFPAYRVYECRTGRVAVAALEPHFRERLYGALRLPMDSDLTGVMRTRTAAGWQRWARRHDLPIVPVAEPEVTAPRSSRSARGRPRDSGHGRPSRRS